MVEHGRMVESVPDSYKNHEMCNKTVDNYPHTLTFVLNCYITQNMCHEAVDGCLAALKFISDWFVTSKMYEKSDNALHANDDILYNEDFDKATITYSSCRS